jgi:hypothetical protein
LPCFFDPLQIDNRQVLPINPLLASGLRASASSEEDLREFIRQLFSALDESRRTTDCYRRKDLKACRGGKIAPYAWPVYDSGRSGFIKSVKYLAAIPLFDPQTLSGQVPDHAVRMRLHGNLGHAVVRLMSYTDRTLGNTVQTAAFGALGSTSHRGGDSTSFLTFREGFLTIVKAIAESRPPTTMDRVYLVAFEKHTGVFRAEALEGLQAVADHLNLVSVLGGRLKFIGPFLCGLLYLVLTLLSYQNVDLIIRDRNRFTLFGTALAVSIPAASVSWGAAVAAMPFGVDWVITLYAVVCIMCTICILWLSKRLFGPSAWLARQKARTNAVQ